MLMHVVLDSVELEILAEPDAVVADLAPEGYWLDGRFRPPDGPLELYEGASITTRPTRADPATAFVLDIVGGLHAGRSFPLPRRPITIGRAPDCDIVIDDPTISPRHASIDEHRAVTDLGSVNGTSIDGDLMRFGATQARIRPGHVDERVAGPFNRPPRQPPPRRDDPPQEPVAPERTRTLGVAAIVGPALMGGALVVVYGDLRFALLALIGPVVALLGLLGTRRSWRKLRRRHRHALKQHERALAQHREHEVRRLELLAPDPCVMARHLWSRRPGDEDFGLVRLGLRNDMPVIANALDGMIGITGDHAAAIAVARSIVCQVAAHHGPADVFIRVRDDEDEWDWAKWLPHRSNTNAPATLEVTVAPTEAELPARCSTVVTMSSDIGDANDYLACGMDEPTARAFARWLARFEDPELDAATTLPEMVPLSALTPDSELDGHGVPIGVSDGGVVTIDLVRDGPHGLIAGTTGSGKSELLRTLIAGLARRYTPDELVFVLVDYKGGSTFDQCARLPHCVGLVTDLDDHLGARALRSLEAELRHRERAQRDCRKAEPRLVVVIDEFATLAAELPDFLGALVGIAQRGRSLGMHLLLATQRPSGAVNANIKANTNLRIALRVQDAADSNDVIDIPDAALISRATPGRAFVRRGSGDVVLVQTATSSVAARQRARTTVRTRPFTSHHREEAEEPQPGPSELSVVVDELCHWEGKRARRPWLPMLPARIDLADIEPPGFALADEPDRQRQIALEWDPAKGNLALFGMVGSGTSTAMRAAVERLTDAQIYDVDFGPDAHERHARLMRTLRAELDRRRASTSRHPLVVTCIDDVGAFLAGPRRHRWRRGDRVLPSSVRGGTAVRDRLHRDRGSRCRAAAPAQFAGESEAAVRAR